MNAQLITNNEGVEMKKLNVILVYNKEENKIYYRCDFFQKKFLPFFSKMFVIQGLFQFMTHTDACAWKNQ